MKKIFLCVLLCTLLCGCQNTSMSPSTEQENNQAVTEAPSLTTFPSEYTKSGEHINVSLESVEPVEAYFIEGTAKLMDLDYAEIGRMLIPAEEIGEENTDAKQILSEKMIDNTFYEKMFMWGKDSCTYYTYQGTQISNCVSAESKASDYNLAVYNEKKDFSFGKAEEILENLKTDIKEMGIEIDSSYDIHTYYLDHELLQQQEKHYDMDGNRLEDEYKTDWSEADDAYIFYFHQTYCDLMDYHSVDNQSVRADEDSAQIIVMCGRDGILFMQIKNMSIYQMGNEQLELMSFDEVIDLVVDYYDSILDDASYEITNAQLICDYAALDGISNEKEIVPVWAFHVEETNIEGVSVNYELRVNAQTGKILQ